MRPSLNLKIATPTYGSHHNWQMCITLLSSLIDYNQVGHIEGTGLWNGSVQVGLDTNNSNIDRGRIIWSDRKGLSANDNFKGKVMSTESNLSNIFGGLATASMGDGVAWY